MAASSSALGQEMVKRKAESPLASTSCRMECAEGEEGAGGEVVRLAVDGDADAGL